MSWTLCVMSVGLFPSSTPEGNWDIVSKPLSFHRSRLVYTVHIPQRNNILVFFAWVSCSPRTSFTSLVHIPDRGFS